VFASLVVQSAVLRAQEPLPTAAEVVAGYRRNLAQFPQPHVTIHGAERTSAPMHRLWQSRVVAMERALADPSRSDNQRKHAQLVLAAARDELARAGEVTYTHQDFWTDRKSWQARMPYAGPDGDQPPMHTFPRDLPGAAALAGVYRRYRVYTFAPDASPSMSAWLGLPNPGAPAYARVSDALLDELPANFHLPPLAATAGKSSQLAHPIDAVFFRKGEPLRVVAHEMVSGRRTIKIEQAMFEPSGEPHRAAGELAVGEVITAWIDPEQGYLPLRVEWHSAWQLGGRPLNQPHRPVHAVLRTTRIERIGGGFYPLEGTIEFRSLHPAAGPAVSIDEMAAGKAYDPQMISQRELAWRVETAEPRGGADERIYRVEFPARTEIFDETRLVTPPRLSPLALGQAAPELRVTGWTDGAERRLADYRGKVVVLYFWIAWQEPCMAPLGLLEAIEKKYGPHGLAVLGVHVGNIELAELRRAMAGAGTSFPAALDSGTEQTPTSTLAAYRIQLYPTTLILDRQGRVAFSTADDVRAGDWSRQAAASLGITFPLPQGLSEVEESRMWKRIYGAMLEGQLERILGSR
jgi:thiol-disulfide isomerase/thioredoxin